MYTLILLIGTCVLLSPPMLARYPGIRTTRHAGQKIITVTNKTTDTVYLRLKPTHVHQPCAECAENTGTIDDCCSNTSILYEFAIAPGETKKIDLATVNVGEPNTDTEYLDFTNIVYGKIYTKNRKNFSYITLKNNAQYSINQETNTLVIT